MLTVTTEVILGSARRAYELSGETIRIGRNADCELVLMLSWLEGCVAILEPIHGASFPTDAIRVNVPDHVQGRVEVGGVWVAADHSAVCQLPVMVKFSGPVPGQIVEVLLVSAGGPPVLAQAPAATDGSLASAILAADKALIEPAADDWRASPPITSTPRSHRPPQRRTKGLWIMGLCATVAACVAAFFAGKMAARTSDAVVASTVGPATTDPSDVVTLTAGLSQSRAERKRLEQMLAQANADLETTRGQLDRKSAEQARGDQTIIDLRTQLNRRSTTASGLPPPAPVAPPPVVRPASVDPAAAARAVAAAEEARQARATEEFLQASNVKNGAEGSKAWEAATEGIRARLTGGSLKLPLLEDPLVWVVKANSGVILVRGYADEYSSTGVPLRYFFLARVKAGTATGGQELMSLELIN